jgi:hypothetical protein
MVDEQSLLEAAQVAAFYERLLENVPPLSERPDFESQASSSSLLGTQRSVSVGSIDRSSIPLPDSDEDSDSGVEEIVEESTAIIAISQVPERPGAPALRGDDPSSGEEEIEEEGISSSGTFQVEGARKRPLQTPIEYPVVPKRLNLLRVRPRYIGINLKRAWRGISAALSGRLDQRSKQNTRLLQALPSFVVVPAVRSFSAQHLGKWLQSPALSGPARLLFTSTVNMLKNADPPLKEDLEAIDAILSMQLKANQLCIHIECVTNIAKRRLLPAIFF